jgi:hypothetical protein
MDLYDASRLPTRWRWVFGICVLLLLVAGGVEFAQHRPQPRDCDACGYPLVACAQRWADRERSQMPTLRFEAADGFDVYADDHALFVCYHVYRNGDDDPSLLQTFASPPWTDRLAPGHVGYELVKLSDRTGLVFGTVPPGADAVQVRVTPLDGAPVEKPAERHGGYFAFVGKVSEVGGVEATRSGQLIASGPPTMFLRDDDDSTLYRFCAVTVPRDVTTVLGAAGASGLAQVAGEWAPGTPLGTLVFYASAKILIGCAAGDHPQPYQAAVRLCCLLPRDPQHPLDAVVDRSADPWLLVGLAPHGTYEVDVRWGSTDLGRTRMTVDVGDQELFAAPTRPLTGRGPMVLTAYGPQGQLLDTLTR